jgi:hypothetical protein
LGLALALLVCVGGLLGCTEQTGHPPVARVVVTPAYIAQNDGFATPIALDGSTSADEIDDPQASLPLRFHWSMSEGFRISDGGVDQPKMTVLLGGTRPVVVTLEVTDGDDHLTASTTATIGITIPP